MIVGAALVLLTALVYAPLWRAGFVWDDPWSIAYNPLLKDAAGLLKIWTTHGLIPKESHYWPVVYSTLWFEHHLWGEAPLGYHLFNLFLHAANAVLLWRLLLRFGIPGAWLAALFFAVHPAHVESVAWVIELKDLESGFFYLLAFYFFARFRQGRGAWVYWIALGCFVLAMLSKTVAITFPPALLIWIWWRHGRLTRRDLLHVAPFLLLAAIIGAIDTHLSMAVEKNTYALNFIERALLAARAFWFYLRQLFWPVVMPIYPRWKVSAIDPWQWVLTLAIPALAAALWVLRRRIGRAPLAAFFFFLVTLAPTLGFIGFAYQHTAYVADRFQYLASIGPLVLAAAGGALLFRKLAGLQIAQKRVILRAAGVTCTMIIVGILGALTWREASCYQNNETFFRRALAGNTTSEAVFNNMGSALKDQGRWREAEDYFRIALKMNPNLVEARNNLAFVLAQQHRCREAAGELRERLKYPQTPAILLNEVAWGLATTPNAAERDPAAALEFARHASALEHNQNAVYLDTLAAALAANGDFEAAQQTAAESLRLAQLQSHPDWAREFQTRLKLYQNHQVYIESEPAMPVLPETMK